MDTNRLVGGVLLWVCSAVLPVQAQTAARADDSHGDPAGFQSPQFFYVPLNEDGSAVEIPVPVRAGSASAASAEQDVPTNPFAEAGPPALSEAQIERLDAAIEQRAAAIDEETSRNGERSPAIIDELTGLADLYLQRGDYLYAATALDDAVQLYRMNYGLHSLGQFEIVRQLIDSQVAMGSFAEAASWQDYLLDLTRRNPGDPRVPEILTTLADEDLDRAAFELERGEQPVVSFTTTMGYGQTSGTQAPQTGPAMARRLVGRARGNYKWAMVLAATSGNYALPELLELQRKILDTYYFQLGHPDWDGPDPARPGSALHLLGQQELDVKVNNSVSFEDDLAVALSLIELGDWNLMFSANGEALQNYQTAYDYMREQHIAPETIEAVLSPATPVQLPAFGPFTNRYDPVREYDGYVDVSIKISRYGEARDVDFVDSAPSLSKLVERRLKEHIARTNYRPRFVDGEPARSDRFLMRYYYVY